MPPQYQLQENKNNPYYDYAFLKLSESIKYDNYLKLSAGSQNYYGPICIYGYPSSRYNIINSEIISTYQYGLTSENAIIRKDNNSAKNRLCYELNT